VARTVYRIVRTDPPTLADFLSDAELGRASFKDTEDVRRLRSGRSVYATEAQARRKARRYPILGRYIAAVVLPDDQSIWIERTIPSSAGHYTLWGDAALLLTVVVRVVPV
jgi:hypothetical protein